MIRAYTIRAAQYADVDAIYDLLWEAREELGLTLEGPNAPALEWQCLESLRDNIARGRSVVAVYDAIVIGVALVKVDEGDIATIECATVRRDHRRRGIYHAMIERVAQGGAPTAVPAVRVALRGGDAGDARRGGGQSQWMH